MKLRQTEKISSDSTQPKIKLALEEKYKEEDKKEVDAYERLKEKELKNKQQSLFKDLRKEVETGANGTQKYVIKKGNNKGKIADVK